MEKSIFSKNLKMNIIDSVKNYTPKEQVNDITYWLLKKYYGLNKDQFSKIGIKAPSEKRPSKIALKTLLTIEANHSHLLFANLDRSSGKSIKVVHA